MNFINTKNFYINKEKKTDINSKYSYSTIVNPSNNTNPSSNNNINNQNRLSNINDRTFDNLFNEPGINIINKFFIQIIPNLWIGNIERAQDVDLIKDKGINIMINCCTNQGIPIQKTVSYPTYIKFRNCNNIITDSNYYVDLIEEYLKSNKKILVFCETGIQNSPALVGCYLIKYSRLEYNSVIKSMYSKNPVFFKPENYFIDLLKLYSKKYIIN